MSHNNFGDEGGKFLGQYISGNDTLEFLDISWNNFRKKAAKEIALGIKVNTISIYSRYNQLKTASNLTKIH